jgi:hypothetical protein
MGQQTRPETSPIEIQDDQKDERLENGERGNSNSFSCENVKAIHGG